MRLYPFSRSPSRSRLRAGSMVKRPLLLLALSALAPVHAADTTTEATDETTTATETTSTARTRSAETTSETTTKTTSKTTSSSSILAGAGVVTSSTGTGTSIFRLSGVPTISGYSIPTMVVPWTAGAPFMKSSNLPDGFVFIVVGATLGFFALCVALWRGAIAWSLHRSVRKASSGPMQYNDAMFKSNKPSRPTVAPRRASTTKRLSSAPAGRLSKHERSCSGTKHHSEHTRNPSLFFSPTAGAGAHISPTTATMTNSGSNNRSSTCLPAGYYAAPVVSAPANGAKSTAVGSGAAAALSSLNPLHPSNKGHKPQQDYSPPESPAMVPAYRRSVDRTQRDSSDRARRSRHGAYERTSTTGTGGRPGSMQMPGGASDGVRAPSANLENLFEHHGNGMRGY